MFRQHISVHISRITCVHYFLDDMLWWYFKQEWRKVLRSLTFQPISNYCKYCSFSTSTVLAQQVPFSGLYFDEQVHSLQIRLTVFFSTYKGLAQPYRDSAGIPKRFYALYYPRSHSVDASFTRCYLNRRKFSTYRKRRPPSRENGTWQVPSQLPHSALGPHPTVTWLAVGRLIIF